MPYADDLHHVAREIATLHPAEAHQPSLRRALSTAQLFHLLISDAVAGCGDKKLRACLARMFDHGPMSSFFKQRPAEGPEYNLKDHLLIVAETFSEAHHNRNGADYNLTREWQTTEVSPLIDGVEAAFKRWAVIRDEPISRHYLISMLPSRERKQPEKARRPNLTDNLKG